MPLSNADRHRRERPRLRDRAAGVGFAVGLALQLGVGISGCASQTPADLCASRDPTGAMLAACRSTCDSDGDCLAPSRCDPLTKTCRRPAIACDPLGPADSPSDSPDGTSPSCPADQECDLLTSTCTPRAGAPCQSSVDCRPGESCDGSRCAPDPSAATCTRDADCLLPSVCRLVLDTGMGGTARGLCGPAVGPAEAAARCRQNAECQSGLCLRTGVCYGGCTKATEKTDCHGHEGVVCGTVAVSLPGDASSSGGAKLLTGCTLRPPPCKSDRDCDRYGAFCQPIPDPNQPSALMLGCLPARGTVRQSGVCEKDGDCASGLCQSRWCFQSCATAADCRPGWTCSSASLRSDGVSGTVSGVCTPARSCTRSCLASDEACAPLPTATATDGLELLCAPGSGRPSGAACARDEECKSGSCGALGLCIGGCGLDTDCPRGPAGEVELCRPQRVTVGGVSGPVPSCLIAPAACQRSADCTAANATCHALLSLADPLKIALGCGRSVGALAAGATCALDRDCKSGLCLSGEKPAVCYGPCKSDADCAPGRRCYPASAWFLTSGREGQAGATYDATAACLNDLGSGRSCVGDGTPTDCPSGEQCVAFPDATKTAWSKRCQRLIGSKGAGAFCTDRSECQSGLCQAPTMGTSRRCIGLCSVGGPAVCAVGTSCKSGALEIRSGRSSALTFCQ